MWIREFVLNELIKKLEESDKAISGSTKRDPIMLAQTSLFASLGLGKDAALAQRGMALYRETMGQFKSDMASLISDFQAGRIESTEAMSRWRAFTGNHYKTLFKAGAMSTGNPYYEEIGMTRHDLAFINKARRQEAGFFQGFLNDIKNPNHTPVHPYEARSAYYADSGKAQFYNGMINGVGDQVEITWVLGYPKEEHCERCPIIAAGSPYTWQTLPTTPRAGDTPCLFNCYCHLEFRPIVPMTPGGEPIPEAPTGETPEAMNMVGRWSEVTDEFGQTLYDEAASEVDDLYLKMYKARQMINQTEGQEKLDWIAQRKDINRELIDYLEQHNLRATPTVSVTKLLDTIAQAYELADRLGSGRIIELKDLALGAEIVMVRADFYAKGVVERTGQDLYLNNGMHRYRLDDDTDIYFYISGSAGQYESIEEANMVYTQPPAIVEPYDLDEGSSKSGNFGHKGVIGHRGGSKAGTGGWGGAAEPEIEAGPNNTTIETSVVNVDDLESVYADVYKNWRQDDTEKILYIGNDGKMIAISSGEKGQVSLSMKQMDDVLKSKGMDWSSLKVIIHNHNKGEAPSAGDEKAFRAMMNAGFGGDYKIYVPKTGAIRRVRITKHESCSCDDCKALNEGKEILTYLGHNPATDKRFWVKQIFQGRTELYDLYARLWDEALSGGSKLPNERAWIAFRKLYAKNRGVWVEKPMSMIEGGSGSGNFGHIGRPGELGGSGEGGPVKSVGFTGTGRGMSAGQAKDLRKQLQSFYNKGATEFHHGDDRGADKQASDIARKIGYKIVVHPPDNSKYRAFDKGDVVHPVKPYLDRNHDIVNNADIVLATPRGQKEILRSGTWATVRYARKQNKPLHIINKHANESLSEDTTTTDIAPLVRRKGLWKRLRRLYAKKGL